MRRIPLATLLFSTLLLGASPAFATPQFSVKYGGRIAGA